MNTSAKQKVEVRKMCAQFSVSTEKEICLHRKKAERISSKKRSRSNYHYCE